MMDIRYKVLQMLLVLISVLVIIICNKKILLLMMETQVNKIDFIVYNLVMQQWYNLKQKNLNVVQHVLQIHFMLINNIRWDIIIFAFHLVIITVKAKKRYVKKQQNNKEIQQHVLSIKQQQFKIHFYVWIIVNKEKFIIQ